MRWEVARTFQRYVLPDISESFKVAVVGGSSMDPEVQLILDKFPKIEIHYYGIDNYHSDLPFYRFELNTDNSSQFFPTYDLVLSCQVLEHVWDHQNFFANLDKLINHDGAIWLNCPASNMSHGSPDYFAAGFTSRYLSLNLEKRKFVTIQNGEIGSKRYYFATHVGKIWYSENEHDNPVFHPNYQHGTFLRKINSYRKSVLMRMLSLFFSPEMTESIRYATESWVYAKKLESSVG